MTRPAYISKFPSFMATIKEGTFSKTYGDFVTVFETTQVEQLANRANNFFENLTTEDLLKLEIEIHDKNQNFQEAFSFLFEETIKNNLAVDLYKKVKEIFSERTNEINRFIVAWAALNLDKPKECIAICKDISLKSADVMSLKGQAEWEIKDLEGATESFENATEINPSGAIAWFWLAKCFWAQSRHFDAWTSIVQCIKLRDNDPEALALAGFIALSEPIREPIIKEYLVLVEGAKSDLKQEGVILVSIIKAAKHCQNSAIIDGINRTVDFGSISNKEELLPALKSLSSDLLESPPDEPWKVLIGNLADTFSPD